MVAAGVLDDVQHVELWDGRLVRQTVKLPFHCAFLSNLIAELHRVVPAGWNDGPGSPLALGPWHQPDVGLALIRGGPRDHPDRHPTGAEVGLVVEFLNPSPDDGLGPVVAAFAGGGVPAL
ncbi:hypothetical protein ElP_75400 (plasmid) [Tautonia plasticadhaerens]|uniref:Uncharacterized protein n=2 Tax=Tautonia plasticadhaerens TaxID=2527974 RepID=A0A518HFE2_9BACT|nr:hypothetical protein ElP_75400 [Tautonia plasticadhaerens]